MFREFHYILQPRPNSGLLLILSNDIVFSPTTGEEIHPIKGDVVYLPEGACYSVKFGSVESKTVLVNFDLCDNHNEKIVFSDKICLIKGTAEIKSMFHTIEALYTNKVENKLILKARVYELLNLIANMDNSHTSPIGRVLDYINNNLAGDFSVGELARISAMSESSFRREFKAVMGISPTKYITNEKFRKAKQLLRSSELTVAEIASMLGSYDTAHFCKTFKKLFDITPAQYKKREL